ncbi:protein far1-related sequence 5-like [Gigaspora margarita]|uniref:Protein far1-related sequence 5-like n=1 Tax=Gigaspora margarita TaxID=4874 RepID=A0A8H3WZL2_GIGMA|nr:protein far1-related sequence 5-like [Gigaspora margarita]
MSDNQDTEFEVPENEDIEYEISDNHDAELEILAAYDILMRPKSFYWQTISELGSSSKIYEEICCFERPWNMNRWWWKSKHQNSPICILPAQFLDNEFGTNRVEKSANCVSSQSPNEISKAISKKRKFDELWGLERKVITDAIEDNNEHNYHELLGLFTQFRKNYRRRSLITLVLMNLTIVLIITVAC